jgi:hypothetical protein
MTNQEAFAMIGERADALAKNPDVQKKMVEIADAQGEESAIKYLYTLAIATLAGK